MEVKQIERPAIVSRLVACLSRPTHLRPAAGFKLLTPWLRKTSPLLKGLAHDVLITLLRHCRLVKVIRDDVIVLQGTAGDNVFILLSGGASVYVQSAFTAEERREDVVERSTTPGDTDDTIPAELDRSRFGRFAMSYAPGQSFGELALLGDDGYGRRNASVIADDDSDLLVIERDLFEETLKGKQQEEYQQRKEFVEQLPLFKELIPKFRRLLELSMRKEVWPFESVFVRQGSPVIGLHFIAKGQGKVVIDPVLHREQFPRLFDGKKSSNISEARRRIRMKPNRKPDSVQQEQVRVRRREGYAAAERRLHQKAHAICCVDENDVIGDIELILGMGRYTQTVVCTALTEVYVLDNKNIDRLLRRNQRTMAMLRSKVESKLRSRSFTRLGRHIELYGYLLQRFEPTHATQTDTSSSISQQRHEKTREGDDAPSVADKITDRDLMMTQMIKLFLQDRIPMIEPHVPGSIYYRTKSVERAQARKDYNDGRRGNRFRSVEARLESARRAGHRRPRSRRELEQLTSSSHSERRLQQALPEKKYLQGVRSDPVVSLRPHTASGATLHRSVSSPHAEARPYSAKSVPPPDHGAIFQLTEPAADGEGSEEMDGAAYRKILTQLGNFQQDQSASRAKIICSMMAQQTGDKWRDLLGLIKKDGDDDGEEKEEEEEEEFVDDESFDYETSDAALSGLEAKIRQFHDRQDDSGRKIVPQIAELRRFSIEGPDDVPIPGGTVYIRRKKCRYAPGTYVNPDLHQHVRRFVIPKDALFIADRSFSALGLLPGADSATNGAAQFPSGRPKTAPPVRRKLSKLATVWA